MSIIQVLRILWAYRMLTLATVAAMALGALVAVIVVPPSYEAKTRVMLNTLKPDPVTGEVIPTTSSRTFITTQKELIQDYGVAGQAVDQLGWLTNPEAVATYKALNGQDSDVRRAFAQRIIDRTKVNVVTGTNILEIVFRAPSADDARAMANALRDAYVESTLGARRRDATRNADWYQQQADKEKVLLNQADATKTAYEKANGIVMQDEKTDVDTARLRALATQGAVPGAFVAPPAAAQSSPAAIQLATLDAQIAQAAKTFGPNHPTMIQMNAQRATLARVVAQDQAAARAAASSASRAMSESASAVSRAVSEQTSKVIANREKIERLTQLQAEVNLHRGQMEKALERAVELRQEAAVADSGITVLSEAVTPRWPTFPNKPLIFGGGLAIGAAVGLLLSLILEFLQRRVRGIEDLQNAFDVPLLAVISTGSAPPKGPSLPMIDRLRRPRRGRAMAA